MRTQRGMLRWRLLLDGELGDFAGVVSGQRAEGVEPGRLQPQLGPGLEVTTGARFDIGEEVAERRVRILALLDVALDAPEECFLPDVGDQLAQHARALV